MAKATRKQVTDHQPTDLKLLRQDILKLRDTLPDVKKHLVDEGYINSTDDIYELASYYNDIKKSINAEKKVQKNPAKIEQHFFNVKASPDTPITTEVIDELENYFKNYVTPYMDKAKNCGNCNTQCKECSGQCTKLLRSRSINIQYSNL